MSAAGLTADVVTAALDADADARGGGRGGGGGGGGGVKYTITPLGGAGRSVRHIARDVVNYLLPGRGQEGPGQHAAPSTPAPGGLARSGAGGATGAVRYYADSGGLGAAGWWSGQGADALGLSGEVAAGDFALVLAGRHPRSGERLISAQGSAGRRARLGVGAETRYGPDGGVLYDARDAAALLGRPVAQVERMIEVGELLSQSHALPVVAGDQPPASYLVPLIGPEGKRWVTEAELSRCEDALGAGTTAEEVAATGPGGQLLPLAEAARLAGVTARYLRRLANRYESEVDRANVATAAEGRPPSRAYLVAERGTKGRWFVTRDELAEFLRRRRPPAVRVGFDITLTTEKSLGVLALLSGAATRDDVLAAIRSANGWAMGWLEAHAAATREKGKAVRAKGWAVASFEHHTSRALDPFPHVHNVVANTVEDHHGTRRALDARALYRQARAASALATAEMRWQLTRRLGVRWRPGHRGGWEVAGIPDEVLREFSRRGNEIDDALRELEAAIGRGATPDELDAIKTTTRPDKTSVPLDGLLDGWWARARALGFTPDQLAACLGPGHEPQELDLDAVYASLAAPDGICANVSIFEKADVLAALANLTDPASAPDDPQPLLASAERLDVLAEGFLASDHVVALTNSAAADGRRPGRDDPAAPDGGHSDGGDRGTTPPALYSTREILAVQDRVIQRYRTGRHRGAALVGHGTLDAALARHPHLTDEQCRLVTAFCTSGHRIQCAVGRPGAGKTTAMAAARQAWEAAGWQVRGAAVKGEAARTLAAATGMPTETVAWYLAPSDPHDSPLDGRTVLVIDEASTLSDRDLDRLGWLAQATGATLRLIGDPAQHGAVEAGGMFRVLCERHPADTPELTQSHRLRDPHDQAPADALRAGDVAEALRRLDEAGHLHIVEDELEAYTAILARWWQAHLDGHDHPMVDRRNEVRRTLNRLAHTLRHAHGELGPDHLPAGDGCRFAIGDRVIARAPDRHLHPPDDPKAYVRNGATGTVVALHADPSDPAHDTLTIDFDGIATIDVPRTFFDRPGGQTDDTAGSRRSPATEGPRTDAAGQNHHRPKGRDLSKWQDHGIEHAYAITSWAVQGATNAVSTSRIDQASTRAEAYVDITRGRRANHLYLTRRAHPFDAEALPSPPPGPLTTEVTHRLTRSQGERTAWELLHPAHDGCPPVRAGASVAM